MNSAENLRGEYHLLSGVVDQVGDHKWRGHEEERGPGGKCFTFKTLTNLELDSTKRFEQNIFSFGIILYTTIKITGKFWSLQVFMAIMVKM